MNQMSSRVMFDMNNRKDKRSKNNSPKSLLIAAMVIIVLSAYNNMKETRVNLFTFLVPVLGIVMVFAIFGLLANSVKKTKAEIKGSNSKEDAYCKTCSDEFVYNNRQVEYNEFSAEENFIRDRQRRMRQLDDFLKNGLIDKNEYMVLRSRYEK